jgi:hypothetical protein
MDLRFRHRQEAEKYGPQIPVTRYSTTLLAQSMEFSNHRAVRIADEFRGSVLTSRGKRCAVDLQQRTCSCGRFSSINQYNDFRTAMRLLSSKDYALLRTKALSAQLVTLSPITLPSLLSRQRTQESCLWSILQICNPRMGFLASPLAPGSLVGAFRLSVSRPER